MQPTLAIRLKKTVENYLCMERLGDKSEENMSPIVLGKDWHELESLQVAFKK